MDHIIIENFDHRNMCPTVLYCNTKVKETKEIFRCKQCARLQIARGFGVQWVRIRPHHIILEILDLFRFETFVQIDHPTTIWPYPAFNYIKIWVSATTWKRGKEAGGRMRDVWGAGLMGGKPSWLMAGRPSGATEGATTAAVAGWGGWAARPKLALKKQEVSLRRSTLDLIHLHRQ